jgi:hypothetical protein
MRRRFLTTLVCAALLHAFVAGALRRVGVRAQLSLVQEPLVQEPLVQENLLDESLDLVEYESPKQAEQAEGQAERTPPMVGRGGAQAGVGTTRAVLQRDVPQTIGASAPAGGIELGGPAASSFTFNPFTGPAAASVDVLGARGSALTSDKSVQDTGDATARAQTKLNRELRRASDEADAEKSNFRGMALRSAANEAMHHPDAPSTGSAVFEVTTLAGGEVKVALLSTSDQSAFAPLGKLIASFSKGRAARFPKGARGLSVTIAVEAHTQYPNGRRPDEVGKVSTKASLGKAQEQKDGSIVVTELPGAKVTVKGKVCDLGAYVGPAGIGLSGGCDPSNIGTVERRLASAKIVSERVLD